MTCYRLTAKSTIKVWFLEKEWSERQDVELDAHVCSLWLRNEFLPVALKRKYVMHRARIILLTTASAVAYGVVHDQITVRVCIEYFTVAHPPLFGTQSPTLLALGWGALAAGQVGLLLGAPLGAVAASPNRPPVPVRVIARRLVWLFAVMGAAAVVAAWIGWELSRRSMISVPMEWNLEIPRATHPHFVSVWFAHTASYVVGIGGGIWLLYRLWRERERPRVFKLVPLTWSGWTRLSFLLVALALILRWRLG